MHHRIAHMLVFVLVLLPAQHARATDPIDDIIKASADARVLLLGEANHGDGGSFRARQQLVQRLHAEADVRWIVFESSVYEADRGMQRIRDGEDPVEVWRESVLDIWSDCTDFDELVGVIAKSQGTENPLTLAGMDITPIRLDDGCEHCSELLDKIGLLSLDWNGEAAATLGELKDWAEAFDPYTRSTKPEQLLAHLDELVGHVERDSERIDAQLGESAAAGLLLDLQGWRGWIDLVTFVPPPDDAFINERDRLMAKNVLHLLERIPSGDRVAVIAHNLHFAKSWNDATMDGEPVTLLPVSVGAHLEATLGDEAVYVLATGALTGSVDLPWAGGRVQQQPVCDENWLEHKAFAGVPANEQSVFVDPAPFGVSTSGLITSMPIVMDWSDAFDGVWLLRETHPRTARQVE